MSGAIDTETIDRLFLELSQFTQATTAKEQDLFDKLKQEQSADFYRRMRISAMLFPEMSGNQHTALTWGDIFEKLTSFLNQNKGNTDERD